MAPARSRRRPRAGPEATPGPSGSDRPLPAERPTDPTRRDGGERLTGRHLCGDRLRRKPFRDRSHAPGDLAGMPVISPEPGDFVEHRGDGIDLLGPFECLSSPRDSARSKEHESAIEVGQGHERRPQLIEIRGLIEPLTPGEDAAGDRLELIVGRLLRPGREDIDARRQDEGGHVRRLGHGLGSHDGGGEILLPEEIEVDERDFRILGTGTSGLFRLEQGQAQFPHFAQRESTS